MSFVDYDEQDDGGYRDELEDWLLDDDDRDDRFWSRDLEDVEVFGDRL